MASKYRQFLRLAEQYPLDPTKSKKRDIGHLFRKRIAQEFSQGDSTVIQDPAKCDQVYQSLKNLAEDKYKRQYPWKGDVGSMGMTYEGIHYAMSDEGLKAIREESAGVMKKTMSKVKNKFKRGGKDK